MHAQAQVSWGTAGSPGLFFDSAGNSATGLSWELGYFSSTPTFSDIKDQSSFNSLFAPNSWNILSLGEDLGYGIKGTDWSVASGAAEIGKDMYIFAHTNNNSQVFLVSQGKFASGMSYDFDLADGGVYDTDKFTIIYGNVYRGQEDPAEVGLHNETAGLTLNPALSVKDYSWEAQTAGFGPPTPPDPAPEASSSLLALLSGVALTLRRRRK